MPASAPPLVVIDVVVWLLAFPLAWAIARDIHGGRLDLDGDWKLLFFVVPAQLVFGALIGAYRGRWRVGAFADMCGVALSVTLVTVGTSAVNHLGDPYVTPRSVPLIAGLLAIPTMLAPRAAYRLYRRYVLLRPAAEAERIVVFGAGSGAALLMPSLLDGESPFRPVALLDDDPSKRHRRLEGVPVMGTRADIARVAQKRAATSVLIAIPSASRDTIRELVDIVEEAGLRALVLPRVSELYGRLDAGDIRDVSESDLLGRQTVSTDLAAIARYVTGKRVLVTGAGGSIGSELARQLARYGPDTLVLLDRDESALHAVALSITGRALMSEETTVLCDIRDADAVREVFEHHRPEVVFHAAALKHVPMLQRFPAEALKTNVHGTRNVLEAAVATGTHRFVNISTDKAADPVNVLGTSKRVSERLTATVAEATGLPYVSVRFGNVLGSRGSMLETFRAQVARGGPLTVTDPTATRYFMMVEEAVALSIQAGAIGRPGEVLVLDMGEPVRIDDVARLMAARASRPIRVEYTGLRPGEKVHEVLFGDGEVDVRPYHPAISHVAVPPFVGGLPERMLAWDGGDITATLLAWCLVPGDGRLVG
jgi:FlaA1/EpsC-like NDP-sugar epimerase